MTGLGQLSRHLARLVTWVPQSLSSRLPWVPRAGRCPAQFHTRRERRAPCRHSAAQRAKHGGATPVGHPKDGQAAGSAASFPGHCSPLPAAHTGQ